MFWSHRVAPLVAAGLLAPEGPGGRSFRWAVWEGSGTARAAEETVEAKRKAED